MNRADHRKLMKNPEYRKILRQKNRMRIRALYELREIFIAENLEPEYIAELDEIIELASREIHAR